MRRDYWEQSAQPLNSLCFVAPLLILYELGMICLGPDAMRNGADVWLRQLLTALGFGQYFLLPVLTCAILAGWHHLSRRQWKFQSDVVSGMVCESVLLGLCLVIVACTLSRSADGSLFVQESPAAASADLGRVSHSLSYLGAGIYEELLFRLLLLSGLTFVCRRVGADVLSATVVAVIATSLLFAAAHYRIFFAAAGEFTWWSFAFRLGAGALFSLLFLRRGFGIAVGTHATYDVLVATLA